MPLTRYHNIDGSTGTQFEIIAPGDVTTTIKSIAVSNVSADVDADIKLKLENTPSSGAPSAFTLFNGSIPGGAVLLIDDPGLLSFGESKTGFGLYINVGTSTIVSVLINV
jgi:hypothetical protein